MALQLQTFSQWTNQFAAAVQATTSALVNFATGTVLNAIGEANASIALWFQWLLLQTLALTRASTSVGSSLDTWCADFGFTRLAATAATGSVTFARFTATNSALVLPYYSATGAVLSTGVVVQTGDGTQQFGVTTNTGNSFWNSGLGGYLIPAATTSAALPVQALTAGTGGNVQANTITLLASAVSGVDTVTNPAAFSNGMAAESDAALRARFILYMASLSKGTGAAIQAAVVSAGQNLTCTVQENVNTLGAFQAANFVVTVDDGSGSPSGATLALVSTAVNAVRPLGVTYTVQGPVDVVAAVSFTLTAAAGYVKANMTAPISAALTAFINALPMGAALPYSRVAQVIYDATPGVANVTALTLNGGTADLGGAPAQCVRAGVITIS